MPSLTVATTRRTNWMRLTLTMLQERGATPRPVLIPAPVAPPDASHGWGMLDTLPDLIDLSSVPTAHVPHLLSDLRRVHHTRGSSAIPLFLVDATDYAQQRLLACSDVVGAGAAQQLPVAVIPDLLAVLTEVEIAAPTRTTARPWFGLEPPTDRLLPSPDWIPLLAALALAPTMRVAAAWSGFANRTVYRMLDQIQTDVRLPPSLTRHRPAQWSQRILDQLAMP